MSKLLNLLTIFEILFFDKIKSFEQNPKNNSQNIIYDSENTSKNNKKSRRELQSSYREIKIYVDKSYLKTQLNGKYNEPKYQVYNEALEKAEKALETITLIEEDSKKIDLNEYKNKLNEEFGLDINFDQYLTNENPEFDEDLIIFVKENEGELNYYNCSNELSKILQTNSKHRPIAGYIVFDPSFYDDIEDIENDKYKVELFSYIFLHQFTHILGFTRNILGNIIGEKDINRLNKTNPLRKSIIQLTKYDKLKEFAQQYFNCNTLDYLEIEDISEGKGCRDYIHWDARILLGDYMIANKYVQDQVISEFTLLLLEYTGFYKFYYYTGGLMRFGKNVGCDFFSKDCNSPLPKEEIKENQKTDRYSLFPNEFCAGGSKTTCSPGRQSRGLCENKIIPDELISDFAYTRGWTLYGNKYADYCPISENEKDYQNPKTYTYIGNCKLGKKDNYGHYAFFYWLENNLYDYSEFSPSYGESFSDISFCAFSNIIHKNDPKKNFYEVFIRPTCYEMFCSDLSLTVKINEQYIVCPRGGGYVTIGGNYQGHLLCPDYNLICSQTVPCNNMFDCILKHSKMKEDYKYNYSLVNVSTQIILPDDNIDYERGYELSDNGKCPKNCSECNNHTQCFVCSTKYYLGVKEGDSNPINCSYDIPEFSYYGTNGSHYYRCIDHCKKCHNSYECEQCEPEYRLNSSHHCVERIVGCEKYNKSTGYEDRVDNNGGLGYRDCEQCNNSRGYYCFNQNKSFCGIIDDINSYFDNNLGCKQKCDTITNNCYSCNNTTCTQCKQPEYYINYENKCLLKVKHCLKDNINSNISECNQCEGDYRCLKENKAKCNLITNLESYYYIHEPHEDDDCMEECSLTYNEKCIKCNNTDCQKCINSFFVFEKKECVESLEHCLAHSYDRIQKNCTECEEDYYCINNNKSICSYIPKNEITEYYKVDSEPNPCRDRCYKKYLFCFQCNDDGCTKCQDGTNENNGKCELDPDMEQIGSCLIKLHEINKDIKEIDLSVFPFNYIPNLPNFNVIDHYVNKDYTITVFIHSECTEDLLNQGYFKIDSKVLQESIVNEFGVNRNLIFSVFVTHNFKSHFRYYDYELNYLNTTEHSNSAKKVEYTITNKYTMKIKEALGPLVASLVETEKINIFEKESKVFNNYCQNITFLGIDMPLKLRLTLLYLNKYSEKLACLGEDCIVEEFNFDESTCKCKCKIGNNFEDIFEVNEFTHYDGEIEEFNNFIDSIGIIRCMGNGFSSKNMRANAGFFLILIGIVVQIVLYIYYSLCSDPIVNFLKGTNNPPKRSIMLFTDWDRRLKKGNDAEGEVFIQPRDDADEQLLEEERTYSNEGNESSISIDTNVGGDLKKKGKNKLSEKPDRKVLILLKNKGGKKSKSEKDYEDLKSDSEIIKLNEENDLEQIGFCKIYWSVVSLKQHIINYFSFIHCCKITKSYISLSMRIIRSIFLIFLSFVFNILFLNQTYYEKKFNHFNEKYIFIHSENLEIKVPTGERITYAISNTFAYAMISFILLIVVNFIVGYFFFSVRNSLGEIMKNNDLSEINDLVSKTKKKNLIFFIINIVLMVIFLLTIVGFVGAYGGGFVDYFIPGIISIIFLELFPFLWSLIIALFTYLGIKGKNKCFLSFSKFFMF